MRHFIASLVAGIGRVLFIKGIWKALGVVAGLTLLALVGSGVWDHFLGLHPANAAAAQIAGPLSPETPAIAPEKKMVVPTPPTSASSASPDSPCHVEGKVILNLASATELDGLPGIGPSKAARIVELRGKLGKFTHLEDLYRIKGIKRKLLEKIRPLIVLDPPAECADAKTAKP